MCNYAGDLLCSRDAALEHPDNELSGLPEKGMMVVDGRYNWIIYTKKATLVGSPFLKSCD